MTPKSHPARRCSGRGDEKAWVIGTRVDAGRELLTKETIAGDVFEIMRPPISEELETELIKQVRAIVAEDGRSSRRQMAPTVESNGGDRTSRRRAPAISAMQVK